jgi:hypothetical protein
MPEETEPERDDILDNGLLRELQMSLDVFWNHWNDYWSSHSPAEFELAKNIAKALITCTKELATPEGAPWIVEQLKDQVPPEMRQYWRGQALDSILKQALRGPANFDELLRVINQRAEELAHNRPPPAEFHDSLQEFFSHREDCNLRITWESFLMELATDAIDRIRSGSGRMLQLSQLIVDANPPELTLNYMRRVSACFIWGFDPECIILCRSALDTAFRDKVSDEICEQVFGAAEERDFGLLARIKAAHTRGMISDGARDTAWRVKDRGDKAVHYDPDATKDVLGTVRDTVKVLKSLCPS